MKKRDKARLAAVLIGQAASIIWDWDYYRIEIGMPDVRRYEVAKTLGRWCARLPGFALGDPRFDHKTLINRMR